jgi:hypothetical protein
MVWDDFWNNASWRQAHAGPVQSQVYVDPDSMRLMNSVSTAGAVGVYETADVLMSNTPFSNSWHPARFRVHYSANTPDDSGASFTLVYMANGAEHELALQPFSWNEVPPAHGEVSSFRLRISLRNSTGAPPKSPALYNYMLIFKA